MKNRLPKIISIALTICCLCVFCFPMGSFATSKKLPAPKNVKIVTDHNYTAGTGMRVFAKYKKVKGADGYQIKRTLVYSGTDGRDTYVSKKTIKAKKTKRHISKGYDGYWFHKATVKVRAYKIKDGEKVYGKWSKVKTRTWK